MMLTTTRSVWPWRVLSWKVPVGVTVPKPESKVIELEFSRMLTPVVAASTWCLSATALPLQLVPPLVLQVQLRVAPVCTT